MALPAVQFPVILKPVSGSGSRGIHVARDSNELARWIEHLDRPYLVQAHKLGREFSVDCFAAAGVASELQMLDCIQGHDSFLVDYERFTPAVADYMNAIE